MSDIAINNPVIGGHDSGKTHQTQGNESIKKGNGVDVMALAYYYLIESATTASETALIQAKQLKANGLAQEQLNKEAAQLQWYYVPDIQVTHHSTIVKHTHWTWKFWKNGFHYTTYQRITWTTQKNQATVANDQAKNQQVSAERDYLTQKMSVLQQIASVNETNVNTISDESSQTMQESSQIMDIIQSLTFKALIRQQVQS